MRRMEGAWLAWGKEFFAGGGVNGSKKRQDSVREDEGTN